ncbi:insulinase family protein, partial [Photobacterium damselae]
GLIAQISEPDTNLRARAQRFWVAIGNKDEDFNQRQRVVKAISELSRADMIRFIVDRIKPRTAHRLVMFSQGNQHHEADKLNLGDPIISISQLQKRVQ